MRPMNRRRLLGIVGGSVSLLAGCLGDETGEEHIGDSDRMADDQSNTHISRQVTVVDTSDIPDEVPLEFEMTFTSHQLSESSIPRFEFTVRNTAEEAYELDIDGGRNYVVPKWSEPPGLMVILDSEADQIIEVSVEGDGYADGVVGPEGDPTGCLTASGIDRAAIYDTHTFDAGEERTTEYALVGSGRDERDCPATGTYELIMELTMNRSGGENNDDYEFEWGCTVELE